MPSGLPSTVVTSHPAQAGDVPFYLRDVWIAQVCHECYQSDLDALQILIDGDAHDVRDAPRKYDASEDLKRRMGEAALDIDGVAQLRGREEFDVSFEWLFDLPFDCGDAYRLALCRNFDRYQAGAERYCQGAPWDMMPGFVRGLLMGMLESGEDVSRGRMEAIMRCGRNAVPGLVALVDDVHLLKPGMPGDGWAPLHAARILGQMATTAAVGPLVRLLGEEDVTVEEEVPPMLGKLGLPAMNALRELVDDIDADPIARGPAIQAMACISAAHPELRAAVAASFRSLLQREEEEPYMVGKVVLAVAQLRMKELRDLVDECYMEDKVDQEVIKAYDFDYAFTQKGGIAVGLAPAVMDVLRQYGEGEEQLVRQIPKPLEDLEWARLTGAVLPPPPKMRNLLKRVVTGGPSTAPRVGGKKVGRNDPCPCGSGKKYKQCCLRRA